MHIDRRFLGWGVFFILAGAVPLAVQLGWIEASSVGGWWRYWPLILVGIGLGLVLSRTPLAFAGGLLVAATFGLMAGSLFAGGVSGDFGLVCSSGGSGTPFAASSGTLAANGSVSLEMNCGDLEVSTAPGSGWSLAGRSNDGRAPRVDTNGGQLLEVRSPDRSPGGIFSSVASGETWDLTIPGGDPLAPPIGSLSATLNAGTAHLDLAGTSLDSLSMTTNAGSVTLDLGSAAVRSFSYTLNAGSTKITLPASGTRGSATVNAGSLSFCVPAGAGLRIESADSILAGHNFAERGLTKAGSTWSTPGFDAAAVKIYLSATANVGRIELDPKGGCK